jgi:integrase
MKWAHLKLEHRKWEMPRGYRKRVRGQREAPPHDVPLSPLVVEVLDCLRGRRSGYVFPSTAKSGHKSTNDLNQRLKRGLLDKLNGRGQEVEPITPHDLRRTCSTHLHRLGTQRHVVERTLGHVDSSVAGVYDRHAYWEERKQALARWADHVQALLKT